jgi:hypothetical protein
MNTQEIYYDQELTFSYEGEDLVWNGDIEVSGHSDPGDHCTAPYADQFIEVIKTNFIERYNEDTDQWEKVKPTPSILMKVELEFEKTL